MQASARRLSVVSSTFPARRRLIRNVDTRIEYHFMAAHTTSEFHRWTRRLGKRWIYGLEVWSSLGFLLGPLLLGAGGISKYSWLLILRFALLVGGVLFWVAHRFCYYHCIKCPRCGYNPTRTKEGRIKKNWKATDTQVSKLTNCPKCGY